MRLLSISQRNIFLKRIRSKLFNQIIKTLTLNSIHICLRILSLIIFNERPTSSLQSTLLFLQIFSSDKFSLTLILSLSVLNIPSLSRIIFQSWKNILRDSLQLPQSLFINNRSKLIRNHILSFRSQQLTTSTARLQTLSQNPSRFFLRQTIQQLALFTSKTSHLTIKFTSKSFKFTSSITQRINIHCRQRLTSTMTKNKLINIHKRITSLS